MLLAAVVVVFSFISCSKDDKAPKPEAKFTISNNYYKAPVEVNFTNNSLNASSYTWTFNDTTITEKSPTYTFSEKGYYAIRLQAKDDDGQTSTAQTNLRVYGNIESWSLGQIRLYSEAWSHMDTDFSMYMTIWDSNNALYSYSEDGMFMGFDITENTSTLYFGMSDPLLLPMNENAKITVKFQLDSGGTYVDPQTDTVIYELEITGSDVLPENEAGPYYPLYEVDEASVDIRWND